MAPVFITLRQIPMDFCIKLGCSPTNANISETSPITEINFALVPKPARFSTEVDYSGHEQCGLRALDCGLSR